MKNILCALVIHTKLSFPSALSPSFSAPFGAGEGFYQAWGAVVSVQGRLWFMLRMLQHIVVGKSTTPHCIPSVLGLLLETPHTPQQPWEGM